MRGGHDPVEDSQILPDDIPTTRLVMNIPDILFQSLNLHKRDRRILVRSEYKEAERGAILAVEDHVDPFLVTGQPGIGIFLPNLPQRQHLIFDQERLCFYFGSSCDALR